MTSVDDQNDAELVRWNGRFAAEGFVFGTEPNAFLARQASRLKSGQSALAVSDGEGRNGVWLARQGLNVTSFDFSPVGIDKARRLAAQHGVSIDARHSRLQDWDWDAQSFDVIAGIFFQYATPAERARAFAGICRALKPGGLLLLEGYTPRQLQYGTGGPKQVEQLYTAKLLQDAFAALEIIDLREYDAEVNEGAGHAGTSALIDLVARRP